MSGEIEPLASSRRRPEATPDAVFFVGDSITLGWRDEDHGGWPVRLIAGLAADRSITAYNLGVRGDTSAEILARWQDEVRRRRRAASEAVIVFAFGANDAKVDADGRPLLPLEAFRQNTQRILAAATLDQHVLFVGPAPVDEEALARVINPDGDVPVPNNRQIQAVSDALAGETGAAGVAYLDLAKLLVADATWQAALRGTDGIHPPARGHDIIAAHVAGWRPWASLFA